MALFTANDLTRLSDWATKDFLTDSCDIQSENTASSAMGGKASTWTVVQTVPCAVIDAGTPPQEQIVAAQTVGSILKIVLLPRGTNVHGDNRLSIGGILYHIIDLYEPTTFEVVRRVLVRQLTL